MLVGHLTPGDRQKIMTICTIDVHARDVVANLISQKVSKTNISPRPYTSKNIFPLVLLYVFLRWQQVRPSHGCPSYVIAGMTKPDTVTLTSVTPSSSLAMNTWETLTGWSSLLSLTGTQVYYTSHFEICLCECEPNRLKSLKNVFNLLLVLTKGVKLFGVTVTYVTLLIQIGESESEEGNKCVLSAQKNTSVKISTLSITHAWLFLFLLFYFFISFISGAIF